MVLVSPQYSLCTHPTHFIPLYSRCLQTCSITELHNLIIVVTLHDASRRAPNESDYEFMLLFFSAYVIESADRSKRKMAQQVQVSSADARRQVVVALCGFGRAGQIHFNGLRVNHRCVLKYVVDQVEDTQVAERIRSTLTTYNQDSITKLVGIGEYESVVLKDPEVQAVVVTTPTFTHEGYVRKALEAGKAVFCEKPIAADMKDIASCYDAAARTNLPLFCAFNRRFDPGMSKVQQQVKEGKIGQIYQIKTTSRDSPRPSIDYIKISYGMYHDCAVHDIDMVCWVLGEEPVGVMAQGVAFDPEIKAVGDVDTIAIILKFPSGVLATIDLSRHSSYGYDQRLEVNITVVIDPLHSLLRKQ